MPVQATQQFNQTLTRFLNGTATAWTASGNAFYAIVVGPSITIADTMTTLADFGSGGTEAAVAASTAGYVNTGNGAPITVPNRAIVAASGAAQVQWGALNWGTGITLTAADYKYVILEGNFASPQAGDACLFHGDFETGGTISVSNGQFTLNAPAGNTWFQWNAQS